MSSKIFKPSDAAKLEAPDRLTWLPPQEVLAHLSLHAGDTVADVGAGTGYFAIPMSKAVGSTGRVFAIDSQHEMLELLRRKLDSTEPNIDLVTGSADKTTLSDSTADVVFMANVWHELENLTEVVRELRRIVKPAGRLAVLDWRTDVTQPPGPALAHRVTASDVARLLERGGWRAYFNTNVGTYSYMVIARPVE